MAIRLLLTLLLILSAPLSAGQHAGCAALAEPVVAGTPSHHDHHAGHHHHGPAAEQTAPLADVPADCHSCDAACQAACATVATTAPVFLLPMAVGADEPPESASVLPLTSHPLPLLRPPSPSAA